MDGASVWCSLCSGCFDFKGAEKRGGDAQRRHLRRRRDGWRSAGAGPAGGTAGERGRCGRWLAGGSAGDCGRELQAGSRWQGRRTARDDGGAWLVTVGGPQATC